MTTTLRLALFSLLVSLAVACGDDEVSKPGNNGGADTGTNNGGTDAGNNGGTDAGNNGGTDAGADCPIEADCSMRECGADPVCGTSCGVCADSEICSDDGQCVCQPSCDGKMCGDDGCGGTCGTCPGEEMCNTQSGVCSAMCEPVTCAEIGAECGIVDDGCGGTVDCGDTCAAPETCGGGANPNVCGCTPQCTGKECGGDGCGGSCGTCPAGEMCDPNGVCFNEAPTITVVQPDGTGDTAGGTYTIRWTDADPDDDATIDLYYDDNASGEDGTLIVGGLSEDDMADAYDWDVSGLPDGDYWVYAVVTDPFASAVSYSTGPVTKVTSVCSIASSGAVTVDVPFVDATIDVTLNGQPISAANTGDLDEGKIILRDPNTGDSIDLAGVWDDGTDTSFAPFQLRIVEGTYDIYYSIVDEGVNWPINTNRLLQAGVTIDAANPNLVVDVPTVDATIDVLLNGQPVSSANTNDLDEGQIILRDPNTGDAIELGGVWDDNNDVPLSPFQVRIVAGAYDAHYSVVDQGTNWPLNSDRLLQTVDFMASSAVTIDVPSIEAVIDVTLDGQPVSSANTGDLDEGEIVLRDPNTADRIDLNGVWDDANDVAFTPFRVRVIPGSYDATYAIVDQGQNWPINTNRFLQSNVVLTAAQATVIDVPVAAISLDVTLDGRPLSSGNTGDLDEGKLVLRDPASGEEIDLGGVWDDSTDTTFTPYQPRIVAGTYDIYYGIVDQGPNWPRNTDRLMQSGVAFSDGTMLTVDVPTADFSLDVTLNGAPVSSANTNDFDEAKLMLRDRATGEAIDLEGMWDDNNDLPLTPYSFRVIAGDYDLYYGIVDVGTNWPINTDRLLQTGFTVTDGGSATVDVTTLDAVIDVTLGGQPVSGVNTGDNDEGEILLRDPNTGETIDLDGVWDDANDVPFTPYRVRLVSGEYDVYYGIVDQGPNWPQNTSSKLQCVAF